LFKRLQVHLSTGEIYAAEIKAYSPAIKSIDRLRADAQMRADMNPRLRQLGMKFGLGLGAIAAMALLAIGIRTLRRRRPFATPRAGRRRRPFCRGPFRRSGPPRTGQSKARLPM
jgi:hypothetical protein